MRSHQLKVVLGAILALGNYMNAGSQIIAFRIEVMLISTKFVFAGTGRGRADGFSLSCVDTIIGMRDIHGKSTLMEHVVKACRYGGKSAPKLRLDVRE